MTRFRIATYNLEDLGPRRGRRETSDGQIRALQSHLDDLDADILCLQELNAGPEKTRKLDILDRLLGGTRYAEFARLVSSGRVHKRPMDVHNLSILSRWPIEEGRQYWNDLVPPPLIACLASEADGTDDARYWDRPILHAAVRLPSGEPLHVINVHFKAPRGGTSTGGTPESNAAARISDWADRFFLSAVKRAGQALEVRHLLDRLFDADDRALIAVCGDCNAETLEVPLRLICGAVRDTEAPDTAFRSLRPVETAIAESRRFSILHEGRPVLVDHILASHALAARLVSAEIDNVGLPDEADATEATIRRAGSLHAPVSALFDG